MNLGFIPQASLPRAWRKGGVFDRLQLVQGQTTHRFTKEQHRLIEKLQVKGGPKFREMGIFVVPAHKGFDPTAPWRLELIVTRDTEDGQTVQAKFPLTYQVPDRFIVRPERSGISDGSLTSALDEAALVGDGVWLQVWQNRLGEIAVLIGALFLLYVLLVFHDTAAKNPSFVRTVRVVFLAFTVVGLGWLMSAQLSVVNVITFINALLTEFRWDFFLLDPIVFILWSYVAVALLFWGRGVFCGWLCPFGALQELASRAARILRLPQIPIPFGLSERVWPIKYILFLGLLALSLHSVDLAEIGAEVEPFKTAIALKFVRAWPFAAYALGLLAAGMFVERVFCRYLCPLGAARLLCCWPPPWPSRPTTACSTGCAGAGSAARNARSAPRAVRSRPSTPTAASIRTSASTASIARCFITTTRSARPPSPGANGARTGRRARRPGRRPAPTPCSNRPRRRPHDPHQPPPRHFADRRRRGRRPAAGRRHSRFGTPHAAMAGRGAGHPGQHQDRRP